MSGFKTRFPGGGANDQAILQSFYQWPSVLGNALFVDSVSGLTGNNGYAPDSAKATLIQGQTLATASNEDVVFVCPGHTESASAAAAMTFSKAGVTYQGLGHGRKRPTITFDTGTDAQIIISGANTTFRNFVFDLTGIDSIVACFSVTAADVAFEDCEFILSTATVAAVLGILTAATATRFRVERCRFLGVKTCSGGAAGAGNTACIKHEVGENFLIKDCVFIGKMTQAILNATAILNGLIQTCFFHIYTGTKGISVHASTQADIVNCRFIVASGAAPVVGTIVNVVGNAYSTEGVGVVAGTVTTW